MSRRDRLSGNEAASIAIRQIDPDVIAAFPITPSTEIPQYVSSLLADGKITSEFVAVESEHSAISACVGASAAGVRAMTATSACGLALMHEILYVASSCRLPIVMVCVNRALTGPININNDHSDSMGSRDSGWLQLYSENAQETYDNLLMANRIAEHADVRLPVMVCMDGFITSHAVENIVIEEDGAAREFVGEYRPEKYLLNPKEPLSVGAYDVASYYMEHKLQQTKGMEAALRVIGEVSAAFEKMTGRNYGLVETYRMEDAQYAVVVMGSSAGTAKAAVDELRAGGTRAGVVKVRAFRPFPARELRSALAGVEAVGIMDKSDSFSACGGPLGSETRSALCCGGNHGVKTMNYVYGLGGRDVQTKDFFEVFEELGNLPAAPDAAWRYLGARE